jgi:RNA polymerase sigma-70 factor, ECF subfamily
MEDDDLQYVTACKQGNTEAFGILYDRYLDKIYRFIYYKTFSKEVAEDLTSDVFHKAFVKIASFDETKGIFAPWLYRIARNSVIDYYRTKKSDVSIEDTFDVGVDERTPETLDAIADIGKVTAYLETINAKHREIIMLRVWEGKSYREIAEIIGGTENSAKMTFSRSIRELREKCGVVGLGTILLALAALPALHSTDFS